MTEKRIDELESRLAFLDELLENLNAVVARQDREISELQAQVRAIAQRLKEAESGMAGPAPSAADEAPPHY